MKISADLSNEAVLGELGLRIARHRIDAGLTQADLATRAGVSKRTVERVEAGGSAQLATLLQIVRVLGLLDHVDGLVPEPVTSPLALLKLRGRERKRVRSPRNETRKPGGDWTWAPDA